jgi:CubicO group peptidase (beta-lactamase class C family)
MTAPYKYKSAPYTKYFTSNDWVKTALDLLGGKKPVGEFRYTPLIGPDILSGILVKATGQSVLDFAKQYLFTPLGIKEDNAVL